jgi:outer membrane protein TolC
MNRKFYKYLFIAFLGTLPVMSPAQKPVTASTAAANATVSEEAFPDLEIQLMSVDSIVNIAIKNSPYLKYDNSMVEASKTNLQLVKREWHKDLSAFTNYSGGNQMFLLQAPGTENSMNIFNGYRYGVNLSIPLSDFTTRKLKIRRSTSEMEASMYKKEQTELELRRQVVQEYNNLIAAQKLLKIKSESVENFRVLKQLGEKQFREGTITLEDYALVSDMTVKAEADYELAKSTFRSAYQQFENLIGVKLTTLMKRR